MGVEVDLDAEELGGVGDGFEGEGEAVIEAEGAGLLPEVEEALEGEIEEVSGAAGGVEDADAGELGDPVLRRMRAGRLARRAAAEASCATLTVDEVEGHPDSCGEASSKKGRIGGYHLILPPRTAALPRGAA